MRIALVIVYFYVYFCNGFLPFSTLCPIKRKFIQNRDYLKFIKRYKEDTKLRQLESNSIFDENNNSAPRLNIQILRSLSEIDRDVWNQFSDNKTSPFLDFDWLHTLERSGCVAANKGWDPVHLLITTSSSSSSSFSSSDNSSSDNTAMELTGNTVLAACPMYVKYHSAGEFIFDQEWAQFAESRLRIPYYPKVSLLSSL